MIKKLLFLLIHIMIVPMGSAFSFEKNYYVIFDDVELNQSINKQNDEGFDNIETIVFNNNFCNKYYLRSDEGNLVINVPFEIIENNRSSNSNMVIPYLGTFHLYLYSCEKSNIFNFKFESNEINGTGIYPKYLAYNPKYIYFDETPN